MTPWNLPDLERSPEFRWLNRNGPVHSLLFEGEPYRGSDTEVFAFYASPSTLSGRSTSSRYPAVVLVHGGGGTAFAEWARQWAERGYAAIAMDLAGHRPSDLADTARHQSDEDSTEGTFRLPNGGIEQGLPEKFDSIAFADAREHWPYRAVANVIRSHSLIRDWDEVDETRTAVTGISWGGFVTCLVVSIDHRFAAAVPVYGCGYLHDSQSVQRPHIDNLGKSREKWITMYDPSSHLSNCRTPIMFINGTNDVHYPLDSWTKTQRLIPAHLLQQSLGINMPHGHVSGREPREIARFIDQYCNDGQPLSRIRFLTRTPTGVECQVDADVQIRQVALHHARPPGDSPDDWHTTVGALAPEGIARFQVPPDNSTKWFVSVTDHLGATVTAVPALPL